MMKTATTKVAPHSKMIADSLKIKKPVRRSNPETNDPAKGNK